MKNKPFFSVVVPVHNSYEFIENISRAIEGQTFRDFEAIIVDDGSTDKTLEKVKRIKSKEVVVLSQSQSGVSTARNLGIAHSRGRYVVFLDDDDKLYDNALEVLHENITKNNYPEIVRYSGLRKNPNGMSETIKGFSTDDYMEEILNPQNKINCYCWLIAIKNEHIIPFRKTLRYMEDDVFYIENFHKQKKVLSISDILYQYNYNPNSKTKNVDNLQNNVDDIIEAANEIKSILYLQERQKKFADQNAINMIYWRLRDYKKSYGCQYKKQSRICFRKIKDNKIKASINNLKTYVRYLLIKINIIY